ncbi:MAG: Fur family transcriptional regulator [Patescibacteria group bacterium]|jgi:Fe2+ or Zn2+ uptake regulation protein
MTTSARKKALQQGAPFRDALRSVGERVTPARLALLRVLKRTRRPMSIQAIMRDLEPLGADQVTAYRSLHALEQKGLIRQVDLRHGHAHYELAGSDHHHLVCLRCGAVEDFTGCGVDAMARRALKQSRQFARITQHAVELFGYCKRCEKK